MGDKYSFALFRASSARAPGALNTTQHTSNSGISSISLSKVPPVPISMSSECAPRQRTRHADPSEICNIAVAKFALRLPSHRNFILQWNLLRDHTPYLKRCCRGRRRSVAYVNCRRTLDNQKVIDESTVRLQGLCTHTCCSGYKVLFTDLRNQSLQAAQECPFAERSI